MNIRIADIYSTGLNNLSKYFPLIFLEGVWWVCYGLYVFGFWKFPYRFDFLTFLFVLGCNLLFAVGYFLTINIYSKKKPLTIPILPITKTINVLLVICALIAIPYCYYRTGSFFPPVLKALSNLAVAYGNAAMLSQKFSSSGLSQLFGFFYVFEYALFCLIFYNFEKLSKPIRYIGFIQTAWFLLVEMSTGHNKGIFVICFICVTTYILRLAQGVFKNDRKIFWKSTLLVVCMLIIAGVYFSASMLSRSAGTLATIEAYGKVEHKIDPNFHFKPPDASQFVNSDIVSADSPDKTSNLPSQSATNTATKSPSQPVPGTITKEMKEKYEAALKKNLHPYYFNEYAYAYVDTENTIFKALPSKVQFIAAISNFYASHGFHGLSIALRQPFDFTFGFGQSLALQSYLKKFTGIDLYYNTYIYKVNQVGYPISLYWGTAYVQFASDFTFLGTVFLMGIIGVFYAVLWLEAINNRNPFSLILLCSLTFSLIMITSWWQAGTTGSDVVVFYGTLFFWLILKIMAILKKRLVSI